jgi:hypothetical protein
VHCKKGYRLSRPQPGGQLPNPPWTNYSRPGRVWYVSDLPAGDGKIANLFLQCDWYLLYFLAQSAGVMWYFRSLTSGLAPFSSSTWSTLLGTSGLWLSFKWRTRPRLYAMLSANLEKMVTVRKAGLWRLYSLLSKQHNKDTPLPMQCSVSESRNSWASRIRIRTNLYRLKK